MWLTRVRYDVYYQSSECIDVAALQKRMDYYLAFSLFRCVAILQGVYKRSLQGNASASNAGHALAFGKHTAAMGAGHLRKYKSSVTPSSAGTSRGFSTDRYGDFANANDNININPHPCCEIPQVLLMLLYFSEHYYGYRTTIAAAITKGRFRLLCSLN